jgi:hypothetical protein
MTEWERQEQVCARFGVPVCPSPPELKVGMAIATVDGGPPLHGLRHRPEGDTTGWYIWAGEELSSKADFFQPLHVAHLDTLCPAIIPYLGLPPGWRFLIAPDQTDIWFDESLLDPSQ